MPTLTTLMPLPAATQPDASFPPDDDEAGL